MKKVKVLHLLATDRYSGAENMVCQIIKMYHNDQNIQMVYCSLDGDIRASLSEQGVTFFSLKKLNYTSLKKIVEEYKPDIIHAHDIKASCLASLYGRSIPVISHIHGNSVEMRRMSLKSILFYLASYRIKHVFWVSNSSLTDFKFKNHLLKKSSVLPNIISCDEIKKKAGVSKKKYDLIFVGRLVDIKNPLRIMQILEKVLVKKSDVSLAMVGDGILKETVIDYVASHHLEKNVTILGFQSNPYQFMRKSKIMIMASKYEGTPMCALEAMALGLPIISTKTDGLVDLIDSTKDGYLSNDDTELANAIISLLNNENEYQKMSNQALAKAQKVNDIQKYKNELNKYYVK